MTQLLLPFIAMSAFPPKRRCRVLPPPAPLYWTIVVAPTRIAGLGVPIALEKREAVVAPAVAARNEGIAWRRNLARYEAALGLIAQHRDKLGAVVGLAAQRLVRDDDRGNTTTWISVRAMLRLQATSPAPFPPIP